MTFHRVPRIGLISRFCSYAQTCLFGLLISFHLDFLLLVPKKKRTTLYLLLCYSALIIGLSGHLSLSYIDYNVDAINFLSSNLQLSQYAATCPGHYEFHPPPQFRVSAFALQSTTIKSCRRSQKNTLVFFFQKKVLSVQMLTVFQAE